MTPVKTERSTGWLYTYSVPLHQQVARVTPSSKDNRDLFNTTAVDTVLRNFYVNDCLKSVGSDEELCQNLKAICQRGGFNLMKSISNSRAVLATIPQVQKAKEVKDLDLDQDLLPREESIGSTVVCPLTVSNSKSSSKANHPPDETSSLWLAPSTIHWES